MRLVKAVCHCVFSIVQCYFFSNERNSNFGKCAYPHFCQELDETIGTTPCAYLSNIKLR